MTVKYQNPPVIYAVAKLIFAESIGSYSEEKYKILLNSLKGLGFDSYVMSKIIGIQLKQADNQFSATRASTERVGYFTSKRTMCAVIDESTIELRLTEYDNHAKFLDAFCRFIELCKINEVTLGNRLKEMELHYVDLFVSGEYQLQAMFNNITLPNSQFHCETDDLLRVGAIQFTRVLSSGRTKVAVTLEQLKSGESKRRKYLPNTLIDPDSKLLMPLNVERLFEDAKVVDYAIVHTCCSAITDDPAVELKQIRDKFESLYQQSRKTFDAMINQHICHAIWQPID